MENDVVDVEPDRVRILSSLDGRRNRPGRGSRGGVTSPSRAPARWWSHVLLGLMGMGLFTVALAVFLIIKSSRESDLPLTRWDVTNPQAAASVHDPDALLNSQPPGAGLLSEEVAEAETFGLLHKDQDVPTTLAEASAPALPALEGGARIESVPAVDKAASAATHAKVVITKDANILVTNPELKPAEPASTEPSSVVAPAAPEATRRTQAPSATKTASAKVASPPATSKTASKAASSSSADVRLLEAVFPKHDPRKATKAELFKACQGMTGAEAAICRARICVQHPGVPACQ
jgi:hypothetical protein